jgi:hypothetical protein
VEALVGHRVAGKLLFGAVEVGWIRQLPPEARHPGFTHGVPGVSADFTEHQRMRGVARTAEHRQHVVLPVDLQPQPVPVEGQ